MKILTGVYQPDSGRILIAGKPARLLDSADANRKGIGMVFQEQSLLTNLTVGENIYLGNEAQFTRMGVVDWRRALRCGRATTGEGRGSTSIRGRGRTISTSPRGRWWRSPRR